MRAGGSLDQLSHAPTGLFNNSVRLDRLGVAATTIGRTVFAEESIGGFVDNLRLRPGRGGVVEVDAGWFHVVHYSGQDGGWHADGMAELMLDEDVSVWEFVGVFGRNVLVFLALLGASMDVADWQPSVMPAVWTMSRVG